MTDEYEVADENQVKILVDKINALKLKKGQFWFFSSCPKITNHYSHFKDLYYLTYKIIYFNIFKLFHKNT